MWFTDLWTAQNEQCAYNTTELVRTKRFPALNKAKYPLQKEICKPLLQHIIFFALKIVARRNIKLPKRL